MPAWFYSLPIYFALVSTFIFCNLISLVGHFFSHRFLFRVDSNDVVNKVVWQTILFFTTIFITFWIATNWSNLGQLELTSIREATTIEQLYNDLDSLESDQRKSIEQNLFNYLNSVIEDEYPNLSAGKLNQKTTAMYRTLVLSIYEYTPAKNMAEEMRYHRILEQLSQLSNYREDRLNYLEGNLRGPLLVFFLVMIIIGCFWTGFVKTKSLAFTLFIIMSQNLIISSSCWLILEMDKPFQGELSADNSAFITVRQELQYFTKLHSK